MLALTLADFWILLGLCLSGAAAALTLRRAYRVTQPLYWDLLGPLATYHGFAWAQFGAALAFAIPSAAGLMPLIYTVFAGTAGGEAGFLLVGALLWAGFAIIFYLATAIAGFLGYVRHVRLGAPGGRINVFSQFVAVMLLSAPLVWLLAVHIAPQLLVVADITWRSIYLLYFAWG